MEDFTSLLIVGVAASTLTQFLKTKFGTGSNATTLIVLAISILAGVGFYFLNGTEIFTAILSVLSFAGAFYTFIIKKFQ
jgi:hypothetical protein